MVWLLQVMVSSVFQLSHLMLSVDCQLNHTKRELMTPAEARLAYSAENCSVTRALKIVGEKWSLLILREAFFGLRRFDEFQQALGCARNLLSARLTSLVEHGVLERTEYREEGQRPRPEYQLTEMGKDLLPTIIALLNWGDRWINDAVRAPLLVRHKDCGARVQTQVVCVRGHASLKLQDVVSTPGPGAIRAKSE
jgi:DNA-binding HxlR family transcriptional regulator